MDEMQTQKDKLLFEAGLNYSLSAVFSVAASFLILAVAQLAFGATFAESNAYGYLSFLLPQICIAAAALLFFKRSGVTARFVYRPPVKWWYFGVAVLLSVGLLSLSEINNLFALLFEKMGCHLPEANLPDLSGWYLLPALLIIAVLPAFFEETFFRGIQVGAMRDGGWGAAPLIFLSGALFSLYHGNPSQTVYQFLCGASFALLALKSGSVFPGMLAHFLNNAVILALTAAGIEGIPSSAALPFYLVTGAALAAALGILIFVGRFPKERGMRGGKKYFAAAGVGIAVVAVEWIALFVEGFL